MSGILGAQQGSFGRATLFDIRDPVASHAHPHVHLLFKLDGSDRGLEIDGIPAMLGDDNCLLINPWQPHGDISELCTDSTLMLALYLEPAFVQTRYGALPRSIFAAATAELSPAGRGLAEEVGDRLVRTEPDSQRLEAAMIALVDDAMHGAGIGDARPSAFDFRIRRAMAQLRQHPQLHPNFVSLASSVGLSRSRFFEQFKSSVGIAPSMFVDGLLLEEAIAMLVFSDRRIEEISANLGFSAQSSFSRFFKDRVGFPPAALRHAGRPH